MVIGKTGIPTVRVQKSDRSLVLNLSAPVDTTVQKPTQPVKPTPDTQPIQTQPAKPTAPTAQESQPEIRDDEEIEIVVTGEQEEGYSRMALR